MLVRAHAKGYYGVVLREPGQVFRLKAYTKKFDEPILDKQGRLTGVKEVEKTISAEDQFAEVWMEKVETAKKAELPAPPSTSKKGKVGARPAPPSESEVAARIAAADKMADESDANDLEDAELNAAQEASDEESQDVI